ncbi:MAG: hypothetical protein K2W95_01585 [Candidatus Obscuribacterales bacterium]|nr:hypothetical protein [Candidatus Obscuribacterales bacterium]
MTPPSPFDKFVDKFKTGTKAAGQQAKLVGRITALGVEKQTQKTERDRLLKEIGTKTYGVYKKSKAMDSAQLMEEIVSELNHLERIELRLEEIDVEIAQMRAEYAARNEGKEVVDADVEEATDDEVQDEEK